MKFRTPSFEGRPCDSSGINGFKMAHWSSFSACRFIGSLDQIASISSRKSFGTPPSEQDFEEFWRGCDSIKAEGLERVFSVSNTILTMLVCGACIVCDIDNAFHGPRWSPEHIGYRMGVLAYEQNAKLAAKGVRAIFRANYVPGMGHKLELHHAG